MALTIVGTLDATLERVRRRCADLGGRLAVSTDGGAWTAEFDPGARRRKLTASDPASPEMALRALEKAIEEKAAERPRRRKAAEPPPANGHGDGVVTPTP